MDVARTRRVDKSRRTLVRQVPGGVDLRRLLFGSAKSFISVDIQLSSLSGIRNIVRAIFSFTGRNMDVVRQGVKRRSPQRSFRFVTCHRI